MAATKILARGWTFEIDTGSGTPTWTTINGITSFSVTRSKSDVDITDFSDNGWAAHLVASRGWEITLEGYWLEDETGVKDPGQKAVDDLGLLIGSTSTDSFRMTSPGGKVYTFDASAEVTGPGGGVNEATKWSAKLTVSGQVTVA